MDGLLPLPMYACMNAQENVHLNFMGPKTPIIQINETEKYNLILYTDLGCHLTV